MFQTFDDSKRLQQSSDYVAISQNHQNNLSSLQSQLGIIYAKAAHKQIQSMTNVKDVIQETYGTSEELLMGGSSSQLENQQRSAKAFPRRTSGARFVMRPQSGEPRQVGNSSNSAKKLSSSKANIKSPVNSNIYAEAKMRSTGGFTKNYVNRRENPSHASNADITSTKQSSIVKYRATKFSQKSEKD